MSLKRLQTIHRCAPVPGARSLPVAPGICHFADFSQALMAALKLIASGWSGQRFSSGENPWDFFDGKKRLPGKHTKKTGWTWPRVSRWFSQVNMEIVHMSNYQRVVLLWEKTMVSGEGFSMFFLQPIHWTMPFTSNFGWNTVDGPAKSCTTKRMVKTLLTIYELVPSTVAGKL